MLAVSEYALSIRLIFIADAVKRLNTVELIIVGAKFSSDAFYMAVYGTVF